jgi:AcrR family transcriptional regulator
MTLRLKILEATLEIFNEKGPSLTLTDICQVLKISKKTIYTVFKDKEDLLMEMMDWCFSEIKASEKEIVNDPTLTITEKIKKVIIVLPARYKEFNWRQLANVRDKYPVLHKAMQRRIESDWEGTIELIEQGIEEGVVQPISIPVLKLMIEASIVHFLECDELEKENIPYPEALDQMMKILMYGLSVNNKEE